MSEIKYRKVKTDDIEILYREAGNKSAPVLLLLHGFPSSGHMFRDLIPRLADKYRVIAPDLPGFGQTEMPASNTFEYTFKNLAKVIGRFTEVLGLAKFAIYIFDYGAPIGLRLALDHPERITAIISQNGNAYAEGLSEGWNPIRAYWKDPSPENRDALRMLLTPEATYWQYSEGVADKSSISPDGYGLDSYYLSRKGADEIQLDLFRDYASNVDMYPAFQAYFRDRQPPLLAVWGDKDPFFLPAGAEAYKRDLKKAQVRFFDTGHFALETHCVEIAGEIQSFLAGV